MSFKPIPLGELQASIRRIDEWLANEGVPERKLQPDDPEPSIPFDEWDDGIMHQILGSERLAKPVQSLFQTLRQIDMIKRVGFDLDAQKALDTILVDLRRLYEACEDEYRDQ